MAWIVLPLGHFRKLHVGHHAEAEDAGEPPRRFRDTLPQVLAAFGEDAASRDAARDPSAVDALVAQLTAGMASLCPADEKEFLRRVDDVVPARRAELGLQ